MTATIRHCVLCKGGSSEQSNIIALMWLSHFNCRETDNKQACLYDASVGDTLKKEKKNEVLVHATV